MGEIVELTYWGEDNFSRPIWRDKVNDTYYGCSEILVPNWEHGIDDVRSLTSFFSQNMELITYFGKRFNCEPEGAPIKVERFRLNGEYKAESSYIRHSLIRTERERRVTLAQKIESEEEDRTNPLDKISNEVRKRFRED